MKLALPQQQDAPHIPVLLQEMLAFMEPQAGKLYVDATFGAGGYSRALLEAAPCELVAIDRDPDVRPVAESLRAQCDRFRFLAGAFGDMKQVLESVHIQQVDGIVMDIGVSSMQIDDAGRGFSFSHDGPLDMRMSQTGRCAKDVVNTASEQELADIIFYLGEEKAARKVARAILHARQEKPIERTRELAEIVRKAVKKYYGNKSYGKKSASIDPATRTFQALRIHVNDELGELERALKAAIQLLAPGGRLVVVVFHSLEDRIVKQFFTEVTSHSPSVSRHLPVHPQASAPAFELLTRKPIVAQDMEIERNPRSRSAKLRALRRKGGL